MVQAASTAAVAAAATATQACRKRRWFGTGTEGRYVGPRAAEAPLPSVLGCDFKTTVSDS